MKAQPLGAAALLALSFGARAQGPAPAASPPQQPGGTFRAGVEIVDVDVSVLDKYRQPVAGLTAGDFTVLEDGKPRPIVAFTSVDLPPRELASARWMAEIVPDTQTNALEREGRLVVVLFDRSIAIMEVPEAKKIAAAAIDQLRPADLAAVVYTEYGVPQNFTADRRRLLAAVQQPASGLPEGDSGESSPCFCGTCTLDRIADIADAVRDVRQRRKLLFVIGSSIAVTGRGACGAAVGDSRERALRAIAASNLTVYQFDPSGVRTLSADASARTPAYRGGLANLQRLGNLQILPDHTGGRAVLGNDPARALPEVFRESNSYYVLGFAPAHQDARFHDITVKVGRRDVVVQARRGYYAAGAARHAPPSTAPKGVSPSLHAAIAGLWPRTDLPLTMTATPVAQPGLRGASVVLMFEVEGGRAQDRDANGDRPPFNVLVGAFDRNGRGLAYQEGVASARARPGAGRPQYEIVSQLELKPGRYEVRAAVENSATGEAGSVYTYVDVPNFFTEFVSMSGIFLYPRATDSARRPGGTVTLPVPIVPTMSREFARDDQISAWLEVYQGLRRPAMPGYVLAEIRDGHDTRVFHQETRTLASDVGANRAIHVGVDLPLDELSPGPYLLGIEIRQGNATARRELRFAVR